MFSLGGSINQSHQGRGSNSKMDASAAVQVETRDKKKPNNRSIPSSPCYYRNSIKRTNTYNKPLRQFKEIK